MRLSNYQALLVKYSDLNWDSVTKFADCLLQDNREEFKSLIAEGQLVVCTSLQAALNAVDATSRSMKRSLWLQ